MKIIRRGPSNYIIVNDRREVHSTLYPTQGKAKEALKKLRAGLVVFDSIGKLI